MTSSPSASPHRSWLFALLLIAATFIAYHPAWHGGFLWDDDAPVPHGPDPRYYTLSGLGDIWLHQGYQSTHQYYPLTYTMCWLEYHLWGLDTTGFHLVSILLHALNAILLWLILRQLKVPGAWLAGAVFALHPVNVESAAWIAERKNTLSCFFYLCAIMTALKFWLPEETACAVSSPVERLKDWKFFWLTYVLFLCALLSKTDTIPLPAVILLLVWWKRGKIIRADIYPLVLFLATAVGMGLITHFAERHLGAHGKEFQISLVDRCLVAGRDYWFYLGKLFWPHPLILVYPRWKIAPSPPLAWLSLLAFVPVLFVLWLARHGWGRPVFVALAYFGGLLFVMLGFFNIYYFSYSFVADHFQYLACMGPIALVCAGAAIVFRRLGKAQLILAPFLSACLLALLGTLTWNQCRMYVDTETLWRTTVAWNPNAYVAHNNLGALYIDHRQWDAAIEQCQESLALHPEVQAYHNLGNALLQKGRVPEAYAVFRKELELQPDLQTAYSDLGTCSLQIGQPDAAIEWFQKLLKIQPADAMAFYNLGNAYAEKGQLDTAIGCWQKSVALQPDLAPAHNNLGNAFSLKGRTAEAIQHWRSALASQPDLVSAQINLAWVLATCPQASLRNGNDAVELAERANEITGGQNPLILRTLAAAYAENDDFPAAIATAQEGLQIATLEHAPLVSALQRQMKFYQNNQPYRDMALAAH